MKKMRLLIVIPRFYKDGVNFIYSFPLGIPYISAVLKQAGHTVDCLNMNHCEGTARELIDKYLRSDNKYDFVLSGGISNDYNRIKELVDAVHASDPACGVIMGGAIISSEPELMFNALNLDYAVIGEGEETIRELMECLKNHGDVSEVDGIAYRDAQGKFAATKARENIKDIDSIPLPDLESFEYGKVLDHLHPSDDYVYDLFDHPRPYPVICSRSCPFKCTFCFHPLGNRYRQRSVDFVIQELSVMVKRYRINIITIYDDLFTNDREWLAEFCSRIKTLFKELPWECKWGCQMRVIDVDDGILNTMKDAGCFMVSYGLESYSPAVLKSMKKHITPAQIDNAVQTTLKHNLSVQGNFIFGDVAETPRTVKETLDYYRKNAASGINLGLIIPYPGSEIYDSCVERGLIKDRMAFIAGGFHENTFNMTEKMTAKEYRNMWFDIFKARSLYRARTRKWSLKKMPDGTFNVRVKCPHCGKESEYGNYLLPSRYIFNKMMYCRSCRYRFHLVSGIYNFLERTLVIMGIVLPGSVYFLRMTVLPSAKALIRKLKRVKK